MDAALIVVIGLAGAVVLTVVYGTGARLPRFTRLRLGFVFVGLTLVTVGVPLIIFSNPEFSRARIGIIAALYVVAVLLLGFGTPNDPKPPDIDVTS